MHISIFKSVSAAKPQQFKKKKTGDGQAKHIPLRVHISWHYLWVRHQNKRQAKFCLLAFFIGMSNFLPTLCLTWLKMSEIILTDCKTQIIIKIMAAQLNKQHSNS